MTGEQDTTFWQRRSKEFGVIALVIFIIIALKLAAALATNSLPEVMDTLLGDIIMITLWAAPFACAILFGMYVKNQTGRGLLAALLAVIIYFAVAGFFAKLSDAGYLPDGSTPSFRYEWNQHFMRGVKEI